MHAESGVTGASMQTTACQRDAASERSKVSEPKLYGNLNLDLKLNMTATGDFLMRIKTTSLKTTAAGDF